MEYWIVETTIRQDGIDTKEREMIVGTFDYLLEVLSNKNGWANDGVVKVSLEFFDNKEDAGVKLSNLANGAA